jgi:acyl-CoA thioester hydrolase
MLNAREDHVEEFYGFHLRRLFQKNRLYLGCIQNEIAYLKEVKANTKVVISSKTIEMSDRVSKVEILMKDENEKPLQYFGLRLFISI